MITFTKDQWDEFFEKVGSAWDLTNAGGILAKAWKSGWNKQKILDIPKGKRPKPSTYLNQKYIDEHLANFDGEVSTLSFENSIKAYDQIGRDDGLFVLTKTEMDDLLVKTSGDISLIEKELGIPTGTWSNRVNDPLKPDKLVRIDIKNSKSHDLRMATGNETGANDLWIPGGKTPEGRLEAVINAIPASETNLYVKYVITQ